MPSRPLTIAVLAGSAALPLAGVGAPMALAASSKTYHGPSVSMRWGTVSVTIKVSGKKVLSVSATYPTERPRSAFINSIAVPELRSEVLSAQSASINAVTGATLTSLAFDSSLAAALKSAHV
jgi:uncharacterized protein with FMN-binding domain